MTEGNEGTNQEGTSGMPRADMGNDYGEKIAQIMNGLSQTARVDSAFGEPRTYGDRTIIPVARVANGAGFGMGRGQGPSHHGEVTGTPGGEGGGGGGGAMASPIAVVVVTPEEVKVEPILDITQISLAALASGAFILFWIFRLMKGIKMAEGMERGGKEISLGKMRKMLKI